MPKGTELIRRGFRATNQSLEKQLHPRAAEASRNITTRVIERNINGEIHYFLEESRGFRTPI
ncbi:hypothetical protein TNCV_4807751 [Trichonephila clavipes]|nr:hypothetical protein TNCV_4807751 [Trichonephila clavipes]